MPARAIRRRTLRQVLLLAVTLCMAAQSMVAVVSEVHELSAPVAQAGHVHADHHLAHAQETATERSGHADAEGSLHMLLHHSHCAHCAWMAAAAPVQVLFMPAIAGLPPERALRVPAFAPATPFRPPIAA